MEYLRKLKVETEDKSLMFENISTTVVLIIVITYALL